MRRNPPHPPAAAHPPRESLTPNFYPPRAPSPPRGAPGWQVYPPPTNGLAATPLVRVAPATALANSANPPVVQPGEHPSAPQVLAMVLSFLGNDHEWCVLPPRLSAGGG